MTCIISGIIDLQAIALGFHIVANGPKAIGRLMGKQSRGLQIAVDAGFHEIIGAKIADLEDGIGHSIRQGNRLTAKKLMFLCTYV